MSPITRLGPYHIESLLGAGGMGEVYRARDLRLQRPVALKVLRSDRVAGAEHRERLLREARAASALNHPHIVTVYDIGADDGVDYIAMELVEGESLAAMLARGPLGVARAIAYGVQAADALARAHEAGIVHRDLKPANLIVRRDGCLKVLDFGVAKLVGPGPSARSEAESTAMALTGAGTIVGTFEYMSPEQAEGRAVDARSDIFALGVLLFEMITGRSPFRRDTDVGTLSAVLRDEPPLDQIGPDLPAELRHLLARCLRKDPARRLQSMADVHVTLQDLAETVSSPARLRPRATAPWIAVLASAVLAGAVAAAVWLPRWLDDRRPATPGGAAITRLTFDDGLQTQPVWSPDGQFIAYAADRDGNFDIYVQQVNGGNPVRVTTSAALDWQPDWSPTGNRIVFRSERDRGGLFVVPALGGQEQRISSSGYRPRWDPSGRRVMYVSSAMPISEVPDVYVVGTDPTEPPRRVLAAAFRGFRSIWSVHWHPTRDVMTFLGRKGDRGWDLWTATLDGASPAKFDIPDAVKTLIVNVGSATWAPDGRSLYLEGTSPAAITNVYVVEASVDRLHEFGTPQMLTSGLQDSEVAISRDGLRLAYTRRQERNRVWALPLHPHPEGFPGDARPLTDEKVHALLSDVTADGTRLAYVAFRDGQARQELWEMSLVSGQARALLVDDFRRVALRWSMDGRRLAYRRSSYDPTRTRGHHAMVVLDPQSGEETQVTSAVQDAFDIPGDWSNDGGWIVGSTNRASRRTQLVRYPLAGAPRAETRVEVIAECEDCDLWQPCYSPDDSWIAFTHVPRTAVGESVIHLVRSGGGAWRPLTEGSRWADKPRWAPDGSALYYISNRVTGTFNVWSQRIDPAQGRPIGEPVAVTSFTGPRVMINPLLASVELSVVPGAIAVSLLELSGNIWILSRASE